MLEGYKIEIRPVEEEDPNDRYSEAYQEEAWRESARRNCGIEGAIDEQYLAQTVDRGYLVVVKGRTELVRVIRSPRMGDFPFGVWNAAIADVIWDISQKYGSPEYGQSFGGHCLLDALRTFPLVTDNRRYTQVTIEQVMLTRKQPSTPGVSG